MFMKELTFAIHTLGCKVNIYESDIIAWKLISSGFKKVDFKERADIYIVNTCTVTNIASRKSRQLLRRIRKLNPDAFVVATGCYVDDARINDKLSELIDERVIDLAVPNALKSHIGELIIEKLSSTSLFATYLPGTGLPVASLPATSHAYITPMEPSQSGSKHPDAGKPRDEYPETAQPVSHFFLPHPDSHTRAFVQVQDGCDNFCSYCVIPYVRGRSRMRPIAESVGEIKNLADHGVAEVVIDGISLSSMGDKLLELLEEAEKIDGIKRLRMGSLEPTLITDEFAHELSRLTKLCPHFHLSLQSGCDRILKLMNRHYATSQYEKSCEILRKYFPHPAITTDIIVGFPGESDKDFDESLKFVEKIGFFRAHVFKFSPKRGTLAYTMDGQIPESIKKSRSEIMRDLVDELSAKYVQYYLDKEVTFLSEELVEYKGASYETGYTPEYVRCIKRTASLHQNELIGGVGTQKLSDGRLLIR